VFQPPRLRFIDFETTGVELVNQITEVAGMDVDTGESVLFIPPHTLDGAVEIALTTHDYDGRIKGQPVAEQATIEQFHQWCGGDGVKTTLICANKTFEPRFLMAMFERAGLSSSPFTYRWFDVEDPAYWLFPDEFPYGSMPGLKDVARLLGVSNPNHHEAMNDVLVGVHIWRIMSEIRKTVRTDAKSIIGSELARSLAPHA
jgi:DNA polymerase III alpha subunit (gram-positive type)